MFQIEDFLQTFEPICESRKTRGTRTCDKYTYPYLGCHSSLFLQSLCCDKKNSIVIVEQVEGIHFIVDTLLLSDANILHKI